MLTVFGSVAVAVMMLSYLLESRSRWLVLLFSAGCAATSAYSFLAGAYPVTVIEGIWALVALRRFLVRRHIEVSRAGRSHC